MSILAAALVLFFCAPLLHAKTIIISPGVSQVFKRSDLHPITDQEITIKCEVETKCKINYEYVGKKYSLKMPNGKNYAFYKTKEAAMSSAITLISPKICDRLVLNVDSKKLIN